MLTQKLPKKSRAAAEIQNVDFRVAIQNDPGHHLISPVKIPWIRPIHALGRVAILGQARLIMGDDAVDIVTRFIGHDAGP